MAHDSGLNLTKPTWVSVTAKRSLNVTYAFIIVPEGWEVWEGRESDVLKIYHKPNQINNCFGC